VKRIIILILFLLCSAGVILIFSGFENTRGHQGNLQQPGPVELESTQLNRDSQPQQSIKNDESDETRTMTFSGPGLYKVGVDIPPGTYTAERFDDSIVSKVTIKDNPEPSAEKPRIILTARYLTARSRFTDRDNYIEAISMGGGIPVMPQDDEELAKLLKEGLVEYAEILAERYDGLVLTGGGDVDSRFFGQEHHPASGQSDEILDIAELALARAFIKANKPVLGICRGMQIVNIAMGGDLIQDIPDLLGLDPKMHQDDKTRHPIEINPGTWLYDLFGPIVDVNSTHHQCVDRLAQGFTVVAEAGPVIEAMIMGNILCVQFHPERMLGEGMLPLFEDFVMRCSYKYIEINYFNDRLTFEAIENRYIEFSNAFITIPESINTP